MRRLFVLSLVLILVAAAKSSPLQSPRPDLQSVLNSLVAGRSRVAPGAAAYMVGPHGRWEGAAGLADVAHQLPMTPLTPSRVGSVSKLWTATVVVKLAEGHKLHLDDTVEQWLPRMFPYGSRISIRELLNHTSGLVDDNDINARPRYWLAKIRDQRLRRQLIALEHAAAKNPAVTVSPTFEMRVAAALPLLFRPGTGYHYSNIGYKVAAAIAEKAGRAPLGALYRRFIIDPLKLTSARYAPTEKITGPHALGYVVEPSGRVRPNAGAGEGTLAASGGIVIDARDEARFLVALVRGRIVSRPFLRQMVRPGLDSYGLGTGVSTLCGQHVLTHGGATLGYMAEVAVSANGTRLAVLLTNGRTYNSWGDGFPVEALDRLFCATR